MKQSRLFTTGILIFLLSGCGDWKAIHSVQSPPPPVTTGVGANASTPVVKTEASRPLIPDPPAEIFRKGLLKLKQETGVPILLPSELPELPRSIYASSKGDHNSYSIRLSSIPNCTANACFIGFFQANRGKKPSFDQTVPLTKNLRGYYQPVSCGGSCSPPAIEWVYEGVLYEVQLRFSRRDEAGTKSALLQIVNSAIKAGPR
jgi:hypothetical protein